MCCKVCLIAHCCHCHEIRKNVLRVSQRLDNVCNDRNPASAGKCFSSNYKLKRKDLTVSKNYLKTVQEIQLSANNVRPIIAKEDALLFSKTTQKLKTGNESAHQFHENCFGILAENNAKVLEIKEKLEELVKKHKQLYKFTTRGDVKSNSRRAKEGRTKAKTKKAKRMAANIDNILASISSSYKSSDVVDDLDLSKVQLLNLRQVKWIKCLLESGKLAGNLRSMFLQNLKPAVKKALRSGRAKTRKTALKKMKRAAIKMMLLMKIAAIKTKGTNRALLKLKSKWELKMLKSRQ